MKFQISAGLLDACVLGILSCKPAYGYELTQKVGAAIDVSESTLYPVLKRLLKDGLCESYDEPFDGRLRRYYKITESGHEILIESKECWQDYKKGIEAMLEGSI